MTAESKGRLELQQDAEHASTPMLPPSCIEIEKKCHAADARQSGQDHRPLLTHSRVHIGQNQRERDRPQQASQRLTSKTIAGLLHNLLRINGQKIAPARFCQ